VEEIDVAALRHRVLTAFLSAWPERDVSEDDIAASLDVTIGSDNGEPMVYVHLLGSTTGFGFDGSRAGAIGAVEEMVPLLAENAEGDRWIIGEGRQEYRP
jgi:hypothetical protein